MAKQDIVMPQMGESITNGTITKWHKAPGDKIEVDEILLEISTDKVESEIPSPFAGRVEEVRFPEGETVDIGVVIAVVEDDLSVSFKAQSSDSSPQAKSHSPSPSQSQSQSQLQSKPSQPKQEPGSTSTPSSQRRFYTPLVKALAREHGVDLSELAQVKGTGLAGRVNKSDFMNYLNQRHQTSSPLKREMFFSSPQGEGQRAEIIPMNSMRKTIAQNMVESKRISPHVNTIDTVDMTHLVKFRESFKNEFKKQEGFSLTYTHFVLYALIQGLKEYPYINASIEGDNIVLKKEINLGCAVAVPGSGLVVPIIKEADSFNLVGLARQLNVLVKKAQSRKLAMEDISGGTYTFTNNGSFGVLAATPIILQPQLAIFCVGAIRKTPVVLEGEAIAIRDIMYATHTYDHRLIDGEMGSRFLKHVINTLETMNPSHLL